MDSSGRLSEVNVIATNAALAVSSYQETYGLPGNNISIFVVNRGHLDVTTVISWTFRLNELQRTDTDAVFELGHEDLFKLQLPHRLWVDDYCPYKFRDAWCQYPEDLFGKTTEQDLVKGGDSNKGAGWATLNIANAARADVNRTYENKLTVVTSATGGPHRFYDTNRDAPQVYKVFKGDFDFYTRITGGVDPDTQAGFYVQSASDLGDSLAWIVREAGGTDQIFTRETTDSVTADTYRYSLLPNLRIARLGPTFTLSAKADDDDDWTTFLTVTRIDIAYTVRVGFVFPTGTASEGSEVRFDYFKAFSGGLSTCDYTLDGPNGCRGHYHTPFFGGPPGLPYD
jgi:hypothetical protein